MQRSTRDPEEVARGRDAASDLGKRRRYLFYRLMTGQLSAQEGREFLNDVLFGDVGVMRPIDPLQVEGLLFGAIARHNLGARWLRDDVIPHRELYRQMTLEAEARAADQEAAAAAALQPRTTDEG